MSFSKIKARNALHNGQFNIKFSNCLKISCVVFMKTRRQEDETIVSNDLHSNGTEGEASYFLSRRS